MTRRRTKTWAGLRLAELRKRWGRESVVLYGAIDSTNDAAKELAGADAPAGTLVLCREQKAGRGRRDRGWHSPPRSGLYLSEIFRPEERVLLPLVSVLAGLGVVRQLDRSFPSLRPKLKWPNDLIAGDRKLGGILPEASWGEGGARWLVVGVGINVKSMASSMSVRLRKLATWIEAHAEAELPEVADAVIRGLEWQLRQPPATLDAATLELLDSYDWLKARRARLQQTRDEEPLPGVCVGIAPDGALLFRPDRGALRRVTSGTVMAEKE